MNRTAFDNEMEYLLSAAESIIPDSIMPDLPYMTSAPDVHEWHSFELTLWNTGEKIRQLISLHKKSLTQNQLERILNICQDKRAARGRQSFVMLLGRKQYADFSHRLISLLNDEDINGHVIDTLYKMRAPGYSTVITPFLQHNRSWIRKAAERYIQKFEHTT